MDRFMPGETLGRRALGPGVSDGTPGPTCITLHIDGTDCGHGYSPEYTSLWKLTSRYCPSCGHQTVWQRDTYRSGEHLCASAGCRASFTLPENLTLPEAPNDPVPLYAAAQRRLIREYDALLQALHATPGDSGQ